MNRHLALVWSIAKRELRSQYSASLLGFGWAILNPTITIAVFWVIFSLGFKLNPVQNVPFIVWLLAGFAPWWCFSEIVSKSTGCLVENSHLLKKTIFPAHILPFAHTIVALINHAIVMTGLVILMHFSGVGFGFANLQIFYYVTSLVVLALGLSLLTAALNTLSRDTSQIVGSLLQIGFWATPIFWTLTLLPEDIQAYFTYNPMYYIVEGYRNALISTATLWQEAGATTLFWLESGTFFLLGFYVFSKLRPHFADLL